MVQLQDHIFRLSASYLREAVQKESFSPDELSYQQRVFQKLRSSCAQAMEESYQLTEGHQLELSDDQRIDRLRELHQQLLSHLNFCETFVRQGMSLDQQRTSELRNINLELRLNDLNTVL